MLTYLTNLQKRLDYVLSRDITGGKAFTDVQELESRLTPIRISLAEYLHGSPINVEPLLIEYNNELLNAQLVLARFIHDPSWYKELYHGHTKRAELFSTVKPTTSIRLLAELDNTYLTLMPSILLSLK